MNKSEIIKFREALRNGEVKLVTEDSSFRYNSLGHASPESALF